MQTDDDRLSAGTETPGEAAGGSVREPGSMPDIVRQMVLLADQFVRAVPKDWKRLRLAVSSAEYEQIKSYTFERSDVFHARLRGVPLVVDDDPESKEFWSKIEFRFVDARDNDG